MGVYEECDLPPGRKAISSRLLLKIKRNQHGAVDKYKARLVARGFMQEHGYDFYEVSAPTAQSASVRALVYHIVNSPTATVIHQLDVSTAFLHAELDEEVYVQLPRQFANGKVWRLKKALYGLKQAASAWYRTLHKVMLELEFTATSADPCLFYRNEEKRHGRVFMLFHVDDALIAGCDLEMVEKAKSDIASRFSITDLGDAKYFLGIEIIQSNNSVYLSQAAYSEDLLQKHNMAEAKTKKTPFAVGTVLTKTGTLLSEEDHATYRSLVGGLLYLSVNTRPDLAFSVGCLARYMSAPTEDHMLAAKHVLRYLKGTTQYALYFPSESENPNEQQAVVPTSGIRERYDIRLYTDADFANCPDHRKSVSGVYICEEATLSPIAWSSKLQSLVATSTTEAEFVAAATGIKEGLWVLKLIREMRGEFELCDLTLCCDNEAAVALMKNPTAGTQGRSKHIDVQFQFIKDRYQKKHIKVHFVPSEHQLADIFTKQLATSTFVEMRRAIGVRPKPASDE
jgi:histone deacetylase 1/2